MSGGSNHGRRREGKEIRPLSSFGLLEVLPFSRASICSGVKEVRLRCSLRLSLNRAAVSSSPASPIRESSDPESGSRPDPVPLPTPDETTVICFSVRAFVEEGTRFFFCESHIKWIERMEERIQEKRENVSVMEKIITSS